VKYLDHVLAHVKKHDEIWTTTGGEIAAWYPQLSHDPLTPEVRCREVRSAAGSRWGMTI
jgi:hypothetical protein